MGDAGLSINGGERPIAAITGASSGLGSIYARRFAEQGFDLVLIARREDHLRRIADALSNQYRVGVEILVADLSDETDLLRVEKRLESLQTLEYLVNSAGFGLNQPFPEVRPELETTMIRVHCIATMRLCRAALIPMTAKRSGRIINIASVAGFLAGDRAADYTATKAYIITFSRSLQADLVGRGVRVQALCPGFIRTEFHESMTMAGCEYYRTIPSFLWTSANGAVDLSLRSLNRRFFRGVVCIPTWRYKFLAWAGSEWWLAPLRILLTGGRVR